MFLKIVSGRSFRHGIRDVLERPGFGFVRAYYAGLGSCLLYHRVSSGDTADGTAYGGLTVSAARFTEQMRYLSENYRCLSALELVERLHAGTLPRRSVAVTFDDGYRDNMEVALPILERFGIPATVFVSTGFIESARGLWWYDLERLLPQLSVVDVVWRGKVIRHALSTAGERLATALALNDILKTLDPESQRSLLRRIGGEGYGEHSYRSELLTWAELERLAGHPLMTIGAHTVHHPVLSSLTTRELDRELRDSRRILEERLRQPISLFAYPYGGMAQASQREFRAAREAGFTAAFTTRFSHIQREHQADLHALPRISVAATDDLATFARKLSGLSALVAQRGRRLVTM